MLMGNWSMNLSQTDKEGIGDCEERVKRRERKAEQSFIGKGCSGRLLLAFSCF